MKRLGNILVRLVFLAETAALPYLCLALALAGYAAGDHVAIWSLFGSLGLAALVALLWIALRADPAKRAGKVIYVLVDILALGLSGSWIWITQGTPYLAQFAWGLLSFGLALASLGLVLAPGSSERLGMGLLRRVIVESKRETRRARGAMRRLVVDLAALLLVLALALNAVIAWGGYGQPEEAPAAERAQAAPVPDDASTSAPQADPAVQRLIDALSPLDARIAGEAAQLAKASPFLGKNLARLLDALFF